MALKRIYLLATLFVITLLLVPIIHAADECNEQIVSSKIFQARAETIYIGLVCSSDAKINIYSCEGYSCNDKEFFRQTFKENGILGKVKYFLVGNFYYYDCLECLQNSPAELRIVEDNIVVKEGDKVAINAHCTDPDNDLTTFTYSGWMTSGTKLTDYDDSGTYQVTVKCYDVYNEGDQKTISIEVQENNRPPEIVEIKKLNKVN